MGQAVGRALLPLTPQ